MKDNKLIAEFMGMKYSDKRSFNDGEWTHSIKSLSKFETSWDWLMPVVDKCFQYGELHNPYREQIIASLSGVIDIEDTYDAVVEFINEYNK